MEMNDLDKGLSRRQEKNLLKAANAVARSEFANPQREGCPDSETLSLLVRRRRSLSDSADLIDHIGTCSPCFTEYSRSRANYLRAIHVTYVLASVAAVVLVVVAVSGPWHSRRAHPAALPIPVARSSIPVEDAKPLLLDLRMKGVSRSGTPDGQIGGEPPRFPRTRLSLLIQLPIGSEDGVYDVAFISPEGRSVLETTGKATRQNFVEVLPIEVNLADLAPGLHQLRLRRARTQWSSYSVLLE
jgi:hypothetical protein